MIVRPVKTRIFKEGENLADFICGYVQKIPEESVLVVTSKIAALSEGRTASLDGGGHKARIIRKESDWMLKAKYVWLTMKDGMFMANAGVDESNARGKLVLLPRDSFQAAAVLRKKLQKKFKVKKLGVLITDSRTLPLRVGVTGIALGYAGFRGVKDYRGKPDIFGRKFHFSRANVADGLAAAAVLAMGEGREQTPLALIREAPVEFCEKVSRRELQIPPSDDIYKPILHFPKKFKK